MAASRFSSSLGPLLLLLLSVLAFAFAIDIAIASGFESNGATAATRNSNIPASSPSLLMTEVVEVSIQGDAPVAETSDEGFICATLDWWPPEKCDYGTCSWDHASLLNLNLTNPILENAIKAFSPLKIRLGGSLQDQIVYHVGSFAEPCLPLTKDQSSLFGFNGGCLPMWRWNELNEFFRKTGAQVAFGLNALFGREHVGNTYSGPWNSKNARDLIQYTVDHGYEVQAWELGNELSGSGVGTRISAEQYAVDIIELNKVIQDIYKDRPKPLLVAPDGFFDKNWLQDFLNKTDPNVVNVVSHHIYNLGPGVSTDLVDKMLNPSYLDGETATFSAMQDLLNNQAPWASAWVGEAGGAYNSGHNLVSNAFVDGFWYLDQLGMSARFGTKSYCRQSLIGGNYGLLNTTTIHPNPDYYGALLWSRLMGQRVLATNTKGLSYLRAYAQCLKKDTGVAILLLNMNNTTEVHVDISIDSSSSSTISTREKTSKLIQCVGKQVVGGSNCGGLTRQEFHLRAKNGDIHSQTVLLNEVALEVSEAGEIPEMAPKVVGNATQPIIISPLSFVFVVVPLQIAACHG